MRDARSSNRYPRQMFQHLIDDLNIFGNNYLTY